MGYAFGVVFRLVGYLALAFVLAAAAALTLIMNMDVCPSFNEGAVKCVSPFWQGIAELAMGGVLFTAFTGLPLLFAIVGAIYFIIDFSRWRRRSGRLRAGPVEDRP